jgi:hypothetical protein
MDKIINKLRIKMMKNKEICYMDDAVITEENKDNLLRLSHQFFLSAQKYNMKISNSKT